MKLSVEDLKDLPGKGNTYHRLIEAMKFAFATKTFLGDDRFVDNSQVNFQTEMFLFIYF